MKRRTFLKQSAIAAAVAGARALPISAWASAASRSAQDRVRLGRSGLVVSRLAQGTGTFGVHKTSAQARTLGTEGVAELLRTGGELGLNFWDLADSYGTHPAAREALKTVKRDQVVIMTKSWARDAATMRADLERFCKEIGTERIDLVLIHCVTEADWTQSAAGAMEALAEAKRKGLIRAHGVSCHSVAALEHATTTNWVDVVLARLNPVGAAMDSEAEDVLPVLAKLKKQGKGVVGMKILGAGQLCKRIDEALAYAVKSPALDAFTIGAANLTELHDLIRRIAAVRL
jgi:1-deoxyxylulose-5-phosphate synthase